MKRFSALAAWLFFFLATSSLFGQGVLVLINPPHPDSAAAADLRPRPTPPPMSYKIKELDYHAKIVDQVAQVQVSQSFVNTGSRQMEVCFVFPLPYDGAIDRMTFMVDGKEYDAKMLPAKEAREIYEGYVRRNQDPALLEWIGTACSRPASFPVPPGAERKVTLKFSQLLRKDHQLTDLFIPLSTAKYTSQPVEKLSIQRRDRNDVGASRTSTARRTRSTSSGRTTSTRRSSSKRRTPFPRATSACSSTRPTASSARA